MANIYVRSTDGNNADNGSTWALAKLDLVGAAGIDAVGDRIWVSQNHAESTAAAISFSWAGTSTSPVWVCCGNDGASPPTALATTATVTTTGNSAITTAAAATNFVYFYGITFIAGSGAAGVAAVNVGGRGKYQNCSFQVATTGATSYVELCPAAPAITELINCTFKFSASTQRINFNNTCAISIKGGSLLSGGTSPTTLFNMGSNQTIYIDGFDLSNASSSVNILNCVGTNTTAIVRDCKIPASWSGSFNAGTPASGCRIEMFNCDSGDTNYRYRKSAFIGTIQDETTLVRTGGASDGTTTYSFKMVSNADAEYPTLTLDTPEIVKWNDTTGSAITATVEILRDSATALKDDEIWIEVMYLGTSGYPLGSFISDAKADVLATAADQTSSSVTWTTTGMANANKQALAVTFTPQEKGFIHATVKLAKASTTVYVDPMITVT